MEYSSFEFVKEFNQHVDIGKIKLMTKIFNGENERTKLSVIWVNEANQCYSFGYNGSCCLGVNASVTNTNQPILLKALENEIVIKMCSGFQFVLALTASGKCYSWGNNKFGQLGQNKKLICIAIPTLIDLIPESVANIACGLNHSVLLTKSFKIYSFGSNLTGAIGNGNQFHQIKPVLICPYGFDIIEICCGGWHSAAVNLKG